MSRTIRPWLETFIESELQAITSWARRSDESLDVKQEVEDRFTDDGSNFRSVAHIEHLPSQAQVQVLAVLSESHASTLLVGDGTVAIRARLSKDAVSSLEAGIGEPIDPDTIGDVFTITQVTVISTPYGVPDTHVQLDVESLVYDFHLRKTVGKPHPLGELPNIQTLIGETTKIRNQQYSPEVDAVTPRQSLSASVGERKVKSEATFDSPSRPDLQQAADRETIRSSPPSQSGPQVESQTAVATKIVVPRQPVRRTNPANGDYKAISGLNWDRPTAPDMNVTQNHLEAEVEALQPSADTRSTSIFPAERQRSSKTGQNVTPLYRETSFPRALSADGAPAAQLDRGHHRVPQVPPDQQILLDQSSSWKPSLPGREFPHPNIPIALLNEWNTRASDSAARSGVRSADQSFGTPRGTSVSTPKESRRFKSKGQVDDDEPIDVSESIASDTSSDDELLDTEWEPTPPRKGRLDDTRRRTPELPPDSSGDVPLPSHKHGSSKRDSSRSTVTSNASAPMDVEEPSGSPESDSDSSGDMKMHVPRALGVDPFSVHRERRRGKLRAAQRQKWIKAHYRRYNSLASAYESYRQSHKNDPLEQPEFALAVQSIVSSNPHSNSGQAHRSRKDVSQSAGRSAKSDVKPRSTAALYQHSPSLLALDGKDEDDGEAIRGNPDPPQQPDASARPLQAEIDILGFAEKELKEPNLPLIPETYRETAPGGPHAECTSARVNPYSEPASQPHRDLPLPKFPAPKIEPQVGAPSESPLPSKERPKSPGRFEMEVAISAGLSNDEANSQDPSADSKNLSSPHVYLSQSSEMPAPLMAVPQSSVLVRPEQVRSASIVVPATPQVVPESTAVRTSGQDRLQDTNTLELRGMSGVFGDFAQAVAQLKPGGAFASVGSSKRPVRRAIRVLDWEL